MNTAPQFWIASFYRFVPLDALEERKARYLGWFHELGIKGSILLAQEGINATIAAPFEALKQFLERLQADPALKGLEIKYATAQEAPFQRSKVKLKREIVTFGQGGIDARQSGRYVAPEHWNALIQDRSVTVLDTRNDYEIEIGSFQGAQNPQIAKFTDFTDYVQRELDPETHPKIAMFCTGGIRCEKASAWMLKAGFSEVYHLEGGILNYLEKIPEDESLWEGSCFVFDERVAVDHQLNYGEVEMCWGCGRPLTPEQRREAGYEEGVSCAHCVKARSESQKERSRQSWAQLAPRKRRAESSG